MPSTTPRGFPYPLGTDPLSQGDDAIHNLASYLDGNVPKIGDPSAPFAMQSGLISFVFSATTQVIVAVTFAAGRFTQPPIVQQSQWGPGFAQTYAPRMQANPTVTGFSSVLNTNISATGTFQVGYLAVQMLSGSAPGILADTRALDRGTATCHTAGCGNDGIPINLMYDPSELPDAVQCGVCGQPITDTAGLLA